MGVCAFRDKNVHFDEMDEKDARVEMVRKYLDRRQNPHITVTQTAHESDSSGSEDILIEEVMERPPPAPLRPMGKEIAIQHEEPGARLSLSTMSLPLVRPSRDKGTGIGRLQIASVGMATILGSPTREEVTDESNPFENGDREDDEANILEATPEVKEVEVMFPDSPKTPENEQPFEPQPSLKVVTFDESPLKEDTPSPESSHTPVPIQHIEPVSEQPLDSQPSLKFVTFDEPPLTPEPARKISDEETVPPLIHSPIVELGMPEQPRSPTPVEGSDTAMNVSESSEEPPTYRDIASRARESHFTEFEFPGRYSTTKGLDEAAYVFLRSKSHYLRNPAPLLAPELLARNSQGQLTSEEEEAMRRFR